MAQHTNTLLYSLGAYADAEVSPPPTPAAAAPWLCDAVNSVFGHEDCNQTAETQSASPLCKRAIDWVSG